MASPSESEVRTQISNTVNAYITAKGWFGSDGTNLIGLVDTIEQSLEGDFSAEVTSALRVIRSGAGGLLSSFRSVLDPLWLTYGRTKNFPETSPEDVIARLYDDFIDNSETVNSREFTFGSVSPGYGGSNTGTGTIHRLTVDENNLDLEAVTPDTKIIKCIADEHSGADEHEEVFEFRGQNRERDGILRTGSGEITTVRAVSARDSASYLENPSFDTLDGSVGSLTSIPGWTPTSSLSNFDLNTNTYRDYPGAPSTDYSLRIDADDSIYQNLNNLGFTNPVVGGVLAPMYLQCAWNREVGSSDACTLTLTLGSQTATANIAGSETGWQILRIAVGQKNWFDVWNQEDPQVKIAMSGLASGYVLVDDVVFAPFVPIDGAWYLPVGGATPFLRDDDFQFADSISSDAKIQRAIAELYGLYLPHTTGGTETWSDP